MAVGVCWSWEPLAVVEPTKYLAAALTGHSGWEAAEVPDSVSRVLVAWVRPEVHWWVRPEVSLLALVVLGPQATLAQPQIVEQAREPNRSLLVELEEPLVLLG